MAHVSGHRPKILKANHRQKLNFTKTMSVTVSNNKYASQIIGALEMRSLLRICGDSLAHGVRNEKIYRMVDNNEDVLVRMKKTSWFGHVERMMKELQKRFMTERGT